jgi:hypothetical protein
MATQAALRKFTVDEYHRLAETGTLTPLAFPDLTLSVDEILG